jgi:DNA mismatch repair protein MutS2
LGALAGYAKSAMGADYCRRLPLEPTMEGAAARLMETREMAALQDSLEPFPSLSFPDLRDALTRASKNGVLEGHELRDASVVIGLVLDVMAYLDRHAEQASTLAEAAALLSGVVPLRPLREVINRSIDDEGHIKETATPDLRRLSHQAHDLKQQMRRRLEVILASTRYADVLQEQYFAQREGRYVIPVKLDMRMKIPGIVHDVSASGATVFLEPRELVELNNAIKVVELEVEREVRRILHDLSARVGSHGHTLLEALEVLAAFDAVGAKAAFSRLIGGRPVLLNAQGRIALKQARHPLLVLGGERVVANDLLLDESVHVLVISGPNTGGKTVTLKILGLFALMVRTGIEPSCGEDSEMAFFPEIYADIGDAQDLAKNLSSFSAHMTQMIELVRRAEAVGEGHERALVLLDEPVTSTDPAEGAALAEALLSRLAALGMKVVVTTHYNALKAMAQRTAGFLNASVGFDVTTLSPTYRVIVGMPGGSSAIDIAGRLGMDEAMLEDAVQLLHREDRALEELLGDLQEKQRRLDDAVSRASVLKEEAARAARDAAEIRTRLETSEREERKRLTRKWTDELLQARAEVQRVMDAVKSERTLIKAREAKERLRDVDQTVRGRFAAEDPTIPVGRLKAGDRVEIASLGTSGILLEAPGDKKRVRLRVGETEISVATALLAGAPGSSSESGNDKPGVPAPSSGSRHRFPSAEPEAEPLVDVRGKAADEAIEAVVAGLDRAALAGSPRIRIVHGHGTGRLRAAVRDYLKRSPYVRATRTGERAEGGDGVTIVELT